MKNSFSIFFLLLSIFTNETLFAKGGTNANIIAYDQIASPHDTVLLKVLVKARRTFLSNPISGERVEFLVDGKSIGVSLSGGDGVAVREFIPEEEGIYEVKIRLAGKSGYNADDADMIIVCWRKDRPIILIDMNTLIDKGSEKEDLPDPAPDAAKVIEGLYRKYKIILYAVNQDEHLSKRKKWLNEHSFPRIPLLSWRSANIDEEVDGLISNGWQIKFGIGDNSRDITAFLRGKMISVILTDEGDEKDEDLPGSTKRTKGWREIEKIILGSLGNS